MPFYFYQYPARKSCVHIGGTSKRALHLKCRSKELNNCLTAVQLGSEEDDLCVFLTWPHYFSNTFLLSGTMRCPRLPSILPASALDLTVSPRGPGPFIRKHYLETKIWVLSLLIVTRVLELSGKTTSFSNQLR